MKTDKFHPLLAWSLTLVLSALCVVLALAAVSRVQLRFQLSDAALSLETSRGREAKQQYEYDAVCVSLPEAQAELAQRQPEAEASTAALDALKARRRELRAENETLKSQQTALTEEIAALTEALAARQAAPEGGAQ